MGICMKETHKKVLNNTRTTFIFTGVKIQSLLQLNSQMLNEPNLMKLLSFKLSI